MKIDAKKLFILCANKGCNYADLAKLMGVSRATIYGYKNRNIRPDTLYRLAKALDVEPSELLETR